MLNQLLTSAPFLMIYCAFYDTNKNDIENFAREKKWKMHAIKY